jgi:hypothetical protein
MNNEDCECGTRIGTDEEIYMKSVPFEVIDTEDGWKIVCMNCAKSFNALSEIIVCSICDKDVAHHSHEGKVFWTQGHNAEPLEEGRCCDSCNEWVVAYRIGLYMNEDDFQHYEREIIREHYLQGARGGKL